MNPFRIMARRTDEEEESARIALIAEAGGVRSLPELLPFLPPEAHRLGPEAARAARAALERCSPLELVWFDQWCRQGWLPRGPEAATWHGLQLHSVCWGHEYAGVVALASLHRDGFVRERAVRLLADFDDGFELPYLVMRTNDWVAEVQGAAIEAASRRVVPSYAKHWLRSLGLLERLRGAQRRQTDLTRLCMRVDELLTRHEARSDLAEILATGALALRRASLRIVLSLPRDEGEAMLVAASGDPDPVLATAAARALLERAEHASIEVVSAAVAHALVHPLATVRTLALETALRRALPMAVAALESATFDDARSIRELARHELSKRDSTTDLAPAYRRAVEVGEGRERTIAVEGLAEIGSREDVPLFLRLFTDPNARVRAAAIVGIGRCDGSNHLDELEAALGDGSSLVRRAAMQYANLYLGRGFVRRVREAARARARAQAERR